MAVSRSTHVHTHTPVGGSHALMRTHMPPLLPSHPMLSAGRASTLPPGVELRGSASPLCVTLVSDPGPAPHSGFHFSQMEN